MTVDMNHTAAATTPCRGQATQQDAAITTDDDGDWKSAIAHADLIPAGTWLVTTLSAETAGLDYIRHSIVLHAVGLLETLPIERLRMCAGTQCGWLFLDT